MSIMFIYLFRRAFKVLFFISAFVAIAFSSGAQNAAMGPSPSVKGGKIWTTKEAARWYQAKGWLRGSNFIVSSAVNQLEMWQAATFDPAGIDRELGAAESIGLNCMRVFLHHVAWQTDPQGFKQRMKEYLSLADKHHILTIFVFFDDCWNEEYHAGQQPAPKPGVHNSGWLRDPGKRYYDEPLLVDTLKSYVQDVLTTFGADPRILLWDLYNEPGNSGYGVKSLTLLKKVFIWARQVAPSQPLSSGVWNEKHEKELTAFQKANSDIITYHNYEDSLHHLKMIHHLQELKRPLICTEYMARPTGSTFFTIMPMLKENNVGAINWGLFDGKTNTKYAWSTPVPDGSEPALWFHEIFRKDGTPYDPKEARLIKSLTGK
jgi:hypothetical protein